MSRFFFLFSFFFSLNLNFPARKTKNRNENSIPYEWWIGYILKFPICNLLKITSWFECFFSFDWNILSYRRLRKRSFFIYFIFNWWQNFHFFLFSNWILSSNFHCFIWKVWLSVNSLRLKSSLIQWQRSKVNILSSNDTGFRLVKE